MSAALDNLKEAAMTFGAAEAASSSAMQCNAPFDIIKAMAANENEALDNLIAAALKHYADCYDVAPA